MRKTGEIYPIKFHPLYNLTGVRNFCYYNSHQNAFHCLYFHLLLDRCLDSLLHPRTSGHWDHHWHSSAILYSWMSFISPAISITSLYFSISPFFLSISSNLFPIFLVLYINQTSIIVTSEVEFLHLSSSLCHSLLLPYFTSSSNLKYIFSIIVTLVHTWHFKSTLWNCSIHLFCCHFSSHMTFQKCILRL